MANIWYKNQVLVSSMETCVKEITIKICVNALENHFVL